MNYHNCPAIPREITKPSWFVLSEAVYALTGATTNGTGIGALIQLLFDAEDAELALVAFTHLHRRGTQAVADLTFALWNHYGKRYSDIRWLAATILGWLGPTAAPALRKLGCQLLCDRHWAVRAACAEAIGRIGPDARARRSLVTAALLDPRRAVRSAAARTLGVDAEPARHRHKCKWRRACYDFVSTN